MRQLITRIDDDLHARLKRKAAEQGCTLNALVTDALQHVVADELSPYERAKHTAQRRGIELDPGEPDAGPPGTAEDRNAFIESMRGAGTLSDIVVRLRHERW